MSASGKGADIIKAPPWQASKRPQRGGDFRSAGFSGQEMPQAYSATSGSEICPDCCYFTKVKYHVFFQ